MNGILYEGLKTVWQAFLLKRHKKLYFLLFIVHTVTKEAFTYFLNRYFKQFLLSDSCILVCDSPPRWYQCFSCQSLHSQSLSFLDLDFSRFLRLWDENPPLYHTVMSQTWLTPCPFVLLCQCYSRDGLFALSYQDTSAGQSKNLPQKHEEDKSDFRLI